jgi:hypothetical protein
MEPAVQPWHHRVGQLRPDPGPTDLGRVMRTLVASVLVMGLLFGGVVVAGQLLFNLSSCPAGPNDSDCSMQDR